jgi:hypothetical protein
MKIGHLMLGVALTALFLPGALSAVIITQDFTTGAINPGSPSASVFNVNKFDSSLGTLTRVTFTMLVETWSGHYEVVNATSDNTSVNGHMYVGVNAYLSGALVPSGVPHDPLTQVFAGESETFVLPHTGDKASIEGPTSLNRKSVGPVSANVSSSDFAMYEGAGTYAVTFYSATGTRHESEGAVDGTFSAVSSQGYLNVTYEYELVPEPATLGMVLLGLSALAVRRRAGRQG